MRKILRRMTEEAVTVREAAKRVDEEEGITLLDEKPSGLLVEGEPEALAAIAEKLGGWSLLDFNKISRPDTRVRVKRPPREEE
jgi:hypothetical protein